MLHSTDYQRYKQKLERLQNKVKKSEAARKELEIKFQRLMKERNECEKVATIHKSKYASLLEQEKKRMNRNEKLLHMLEEVDAKAAALATKTERLKILKTQQEFALMNNWRRNNYLHQQLIFSNAQIPNDGISSILKCTQPIDYSGPFAKSIVIDPNENVRYGIPFKNDFMNLRNSNQQPPFESNVRHSIETEKFINNTLNQQQTLAKLNHSQQYPSSVMPFYHCNKDERQFLGQHTNCEPPQQSNQYEPPLPSLSIQRTYGAGYPVPVTNRQNPTTLSLSTLSRYHLPMKIEHNNAYYPNLNQQPNILNSNLIDVGIANRNDSTLSTVPVKEKFMASSTAPSFAISKLPSDEITSNKMLQHENTRSNSNENAFHFDDGSHTYSSIKNEYQQPTIHYQSQRRQFPAMPEMGTVLPIDNSQKTIDVITSTVQPTNLISQLPPTSAPMNVMAIIHTPYINQNHPNTNLIQTTRNNIHTNIGSDGLNENENENENCVLSTSNIIQHDKNDKHNSAHEDDQRWQNNIVNDGYVYEKQLVDCKISETFTDPINGNATAVNSSFGTNVDNNNKAMTSTSHSNMNNIGTKVTFAEQTTQPSYSHSVNRMEKNDDYQYNEFADYASRELHTTAIPVTSATPPNESHFKDQMANGTNNNRVHITNVDTAPSALFTRRLEEKRHLSIDSGIPLKACDDDVLLPKKAIATNNVRRRYSIASNLHNLPENFGSPETFYLSNAFALERTQNANFDSKQNEKVELYHHRDDKDGNSNNGNDDDVINPNANPENHNKYENGNLNMFTTSLDTRRTIEPTTTLNLKQVNSTQNANLWQNDEIIESNDQRSSVASSAAEAPPPQIPPPPLDMINSQALNVPASISVEDDAANQNQTTDINQNNDYTVEHDNMQQSRPFTTNQISDDQTDIIENTMEQLKLVNDIDDEQQKQQQHIDQLKPIQVGDGNEKIRVSTSHSKTVTWADDPHNNYKNNDAQQQFYDSANDGDNNNLSSTHIYTDDPNQLQQYQQNQYFGQPQYQTTDPNNYVDAVETTNPANSYDYQSNQNLYQSEVDASEQNIFENAGYYYTDQYGGIDQQIQPEQQGLQHAFYEQSPAEYTVDTITNDGNTMISATEQLSDGYQQYQYPIDSMSQVQPQQDAYYSVTPGENYYTEYTDDDQNQQYYSEVNTDPEQHLPQQQQQQQIDNTTNVGQANDERIPNYLQSDTDDSQIMDRNQNAQYQDSDFDFSTNS